MQFLIYIALKICFVFLFRFPQIEIEMFSYCLQKRPSSVRLDGKQLYSSFTVESQLDPDLDFD